MNKIVLGFTAIVVVVSLSRCGKVPQAQIDAVNSAIDSAAKVDAATYVPTEFANIQDSMKAIMADVEVQKSKLFKKFGPSMVKLEYLLAQTKQVAGNAIAKKEEVEKEVDTTMTDIKDVIEENGKSINRIPRGKEVAVVLGQNKKEMTTIDASDVEVQKSARLAYSYYPEMTRYESKDINVYVSIVKSVNLVKDTLIKIITLQQNASTGKVYMDSIVTSEIPIYKRIRVDLLDPDSSFKIKKLFGETWQDVDSTGDNRWRWNVTPITNALQAKLVIKVIAVTPNGVTKDIDDKTFFIKVKMMGTCQLIRSWWAYLQDNPGIVVTVILVPLIAFFGKRFFDRKSKK